MTFFDLSIFVITAGTISVVLVYLYSYALYRELYIGIWSMSWLIYLSRLIIYEKDFGDTLPIFQLLSYQIFTIATSGLLLWGTCLFIGKPVNKQWLFTGILLCFLTDIALFLNTPFYLICLPTSLFVGSIYIWTGISVQKTLQTKGLGKHITGYTFILMGIHVFDFPFMISLPWFVPWGYSIDAILCLIIAFGILLTYFEKVRLDLVQKEQYYRLLTENALDIIIRYRLTPSPCFDYVSPAATTITGYTPEEFYHDPNLLHKIIIPKDLPSLERYYTTLPLTSPPLQLRLIHKDGTHIWVEQTSVSICDPTEKFVVVESIMRDITARKNLEQNMSRLDRLNTMGQMAANLAHEIRNPMTTVRGYLQLFSTKKEFSNYKDDLYLLLDELDRANGIITEYLSLCHDKLTDLKACQLNRIIQALFPLIQTDANASSKYVELELGNIPEVSCDENQIRQLLLNLSRNGLEAMSTGAHLTIKTFVTSDNIVLAICDQGNGITPDALEKLGTPFFTTKKTGTGLGLAICYRIADRHQAVIDVETNDKGTTFFVKFPL